MDLVIYGAGGMARETMIMVNDINEKKKTFHFLGYAVDDEYFIDGMTVDDQLVYSRDWLLTHKDDVECVCAIGYPKERRNVMNSLKGEGVRFATLIHPQASVINIESVGKGCIIGAFCSVSVGTHVGEGVFMNSCMVTVGHDSVLDDYVTCFPKAQISGGCHIGEAALIGSLAYIHENKNIGAEAVVAPGSVVLRNVKRGMHAIGNPAKVFDLR